MELTLNQEQIKTLIQDGEVFIQNGKYKVFISDMPEDEIWVEDTEEDFKQLFTTKIVLNLKEN